MRIDSWTKDPCYTLAYELKADGTFTGIKRFVGIGRTRVETAPIKGVWTLGRFQEVSTSVEQYKGHGRPEQVLTYGYIPLNKEPINGAKKEVMIVFSSEEGFPLRQIKIEPQITSHDMFLVTKRYEHQKIKNRSRWEQDYLNDCFK